MRSKTIRLRPETRQGIRLRQAMLEQKRIDLAAAQVELERFIEIECGVDLRKESWELDPELIDLRRIPD